MMEQASDNLYIHVYHREAVRYYENLGGKPVFLSEIFCQTQCSVLYSLLIAANIALDTHVSVQNSSLNVCIYRENMSV